MSHSPKGMRAFRIPNQKGLQPIVSCSPLFAGGFCYSPFFCAHCVRACDGDRQPRRIRQRAAPRSLDVSRETSSPFRAPRRRAPLSPRRSPRRPRPLCVPRHRPPPSRRFGPHLWKPAGFCDQPTDPGGAVSYDSEANVIQRRTIRSHAPSNQLASCSVFPDHECLFRRC